MYINSTAQKKWTKSWKTTILVFCCFVTNYRKTSSKINQYNIIWLGPLLMVSQGYNWSVLGWSQPTDGSSSEDAQSCLTLCDPMDVSLPGSSVHGIFQARVLGWVAVSFSRGSSRPRDWTQVSSIADRCFTVWATREVHNDSHGISQKCLRDPTWACTICGGFPDTSLFRVNSVVGPALEVLVTVRHNAATTIGNFEKTTLLLTSPGG